MQTLITIPEPWPEAEEGWRDMAKGLLKAELKRQNLTYADLARRLNVVGVSENESSIRNKVSRGAFPFTFALQTFAVLSPNFLRSFSSTGSGELVPSFLTPPDAASGEA